MSFEHRILDWDHCYNVRDLGGMPTVDGQTTLFGRLVRADLLSRLNDAGWQALLDYGVRLIIDLRSPDEAEAESYPYALQTGNNNARLQYRNLPMEAFYPHVSELIGKARNRGEIYCIIIDHYPDLVSNVMRAILDAGEGAVVFHCHAGKDRTGIISGMLLNLADVVDEAIASDYAESQIHLMPVFRDEVKRKGGEDKLGFWSRLTATEEMMEIFLTHLKETHGGTRGYLRAAGWTDEEIDALRRRLRAD